MKLLFLIIILLNSCNNKDNNYFPLDKIKSWSYKIKIMPEIEKESVYKKINLSLKKQTIKNDHYSEEIFPIMREDGSVFYYQIKDDGIYRYGAKFLKNKDIKLSDEKRLVLPNTIQKGKTWDVESKTFLILKRYPYYDYRATTNFNITYTIISKNEIVDTPSGKFTNCILIRGVGKTNFIGDSEIGSIKIDITSEEWYAKNVGLVKSVRIEETDTDLFGTTKMIQLLEEYKKK